MSSATTGITLRVDGQVDKPLSLSAEDIGRMPRRTLEAKDHQGRLIRFEGVALTDVLKAAGAPLGDRLRGPHLAKFLVVEAADNYRAVFALPRRERGVLAMRPCARSRRNNRVT